MKYWQTLVEFICFYTGCSSVGIRILDSNGNIPYEAYVGFNKEFWESENWLCIKDVDCICTRVFKGYWLNHDLNYVTENNSFCCNDTAQLLEDLNEEQIASYRGVCLETGFRSVAVIPIKHKEKVLGAIHIADESDKKFTHKMVSFIESVSVYIGEALHNLKSNKKLRKAELDILMQHVVNQVTVDFMHGLVMVITKEFKILTVSGLWNNHGYNENSYCFWAFDQNEPCPWCKLTEALLSGKQQYFQMEIDGIYYELTWMPISSELCLLLAQDVTERKSMEKEMAKLDRLNLIGEISASIGHEIRNPLTSVKGFLQLLSSKENDDANKEYYAIMIEELDRANSIITEFLSLAKDRVIKVGPVSLNEVLDTLYPLLNVDAIKQEKEIVLERERISDINADIWEVRQLIINLVLNGLEAMDIGGVLTIGTYSEKDEVVLYVKDEGKGIEPDIVDRIGNPFVTTKANGTGLGLAVCYSIANRHNAILNFDTGPSGTTFYIRFKIPKKESMSIEVS